MAFGMEREGWEVFPDRPGDPVPAAKRYNASLPRVGIVVLKSFGWEGRMTKPGETLDVPVCDMKDLAFRHKARLL